ncbi:MAG: hypothetical protein JWL77_6978 [Chthonomonadaceae bacterium]|nr:hypothetical protein [Chthonomonadaceae bacterium]
MIEKIGYVKNPLTVIAIFAGLAEVSGTVVLPLLERETQRIYVWFLMLFPVFLVAVFFFVLYKKHHVLYAPTDFKDDKTFKELFENAASAAKVAKIQEEQEDVGTEAEAEAEIEAPAAVQPENRAKISAAETLRRSFKGNGLLAEELVLAKLAKELGLKFDRNLAVKGQKGLVFDGVATTANRAVVAEVRFTRQKNLFPESLIAGYFERVERFAETLPEGMRERIEFIFALATDSTDEVRLKRMEREVERMGAIAERYPFKSSIRFFRMQDLEREFSVR